MVPVSMLLSSWVKQVDRKTKLMRRKFHRGDQSGFTLIEIITVLVILSVLSSVVIQKFVNLDKAAQKKALFNGISELNNRENLTWAKIKMQKDGWIGDESLFAKINTDLSQEYRWNPVAKIGGGTLYFQSEKVRLKRLYSTKSAPGNWRIIE